MRGQLLDSPEPEKRFCIECGVRNNIKGYAHGNGFIYDFEDMERVICRDCVDFSATEGPGWRRRVSECRACYARWGAGGGEQVPGEVGGGSLALHHGVSCRRCRVRFTRC